VVSYVMDSHQAPVFAKLGSPQVSLPNIILGRPAVPEIIQANGDAGAVTAAVRALLDNKKTRQDQITVLGELGALMETGTAEFPRQDPADRILSHWRKA